MLEIRGIEKSFGSQTVLSKVNLTIKEGEFFSLLGPSGCGKSTLLRIIAGLETADQGQILWAGKALEKEPARKRPFNMVFQKYALFPHLTVAENIAFGLRLKKLPDIEIKKKVREVLELVNLGGYEARFPETLSGGQAQRVALARALVNEPRCILLDEPLAALDQKLRDHMQNELRLLQKRLGITFIFVTHDQEEAMVLSDRIAIMKMGALEQVGTPVELYREPQTLFAARFVGRRNELSGVVKSINEKFVNIQTDDGSSLQGLWSDHLSSPSVGQKIQTLICPENFNVQSGTPTSGANTMAGQVVDTSFRGSQAELIVKVRDQQFLRVPVSAAQLFQTQRNSPVQLTFSHSDTRIYPGGDC